MMVLEKVNSSFVPAIEFVEEDGLKSISPEHQEVIEYLFTLPKSKESLWRGIKIAAKVNSSQTAAGGSHLITQIRIHQKIFLRFSILPPGKSNDRRKEFQISFIYEGDCSSIISEIIDHLKERRRQYLQDHRR